MLIIQCRKNYQSYGFSINISKVQVSATPTKTSSWYLLNNQLTYQSKDFASTYAALSCWFQDQQISIKSNLYTNNAYIINKLTDSATLNKVYMLQGAVWTYGEL